MQILCRAPNSCLRSQFLFGQGLAIGLSGGAGAVPAPPELSPVVRLFDVFYELFQYVGFESRSAGASGVVSLVCMGTIPMRVGRLAPRQGLAQLGRNRELFQLTQDGPRETGLVR